MRDLVKSVNAIIDKDMPLVSNLANVSSIIYHNVKNTSWAGFYLSDDKQENLYLSCFQGEVACIKIPFGKGVCGDSAKERISKLVPNVLEYPGHIACSSSSRSEIVVPIIKGNTVCGVIDLDSDDFDNFTIETQNDLEEIATILSKLF